MTGVGPRRPSSTVLRTVCGPHPARVHMPKVSSGREPKRMTASTAVGLVSSTSWPPSCPKRRIGTAPDCVLSPVSRRIQASRSRLLRRSRSAVVTSREPLRSLSLCSPRHSSRTRATIRRGPGRTAPRFSHSPHPLHHCRNTGVSAPGGIQPFPSRTPQRVARKTGREVRPGDVAHGAQRQGFPLGRAAFRSRLIGICGGSGPVSVALTSGGPNPMLVIRSASGLSHQDVRGNDPEYAVRNARRDQRNACARRPHEISTCDLGV